MNGEGTRRLKNTKLQDRIKSLLFAFVVIPTNSLGDWKVEQFSSGRQNEVSASAKGLLVRVNGSAGPLIFPLKTKSKIAGFKISGDFLGLPQFKKPSFQGEKGFDDYPLRIGFVIPGDKKLTGLKKMFAARWVQRLYEQVAPGSGIDFVRFFNVTQNPDQVGKTRVHPASELLSEEFFAEVKSTGPFSYDFQMNQPFEAVALWISIDGDDTKSSFDVLISNLTLRTL
jgi:hypothetical protein